MNDNVKKQGGDFAKWEKIKTANALGILIFIGATAIIVMLFLYEIPDKNRDILNFCLVSYFNIAFGGAVYYFYNYRKTDKKIDGYNDYSEKETLCENCNK